MFFLACLGFATVVNVLTYTYLRLNRYRFRRGENLCVVLISLLIWIPNLLGANAASGSVPALLLWVLVTVSNLVVYLKYMHRNHQLASELIQK